MVNTYTNIQVSPGISSLKRSKSTFIRSKSGRITEKITTTLCFTNYRVTEKLTLYLMYEDPSRRSELTHCVNVSEVG